MSVTSEMGSFSSKDENKNSDDNASTSAGDENYKDDKDKTKVNKNNDKMIKEDESPEQYRPYCDGDSENDTYDTQSLSIMDINDIIGVQTEQVEESTLESEIAALSEIIGDPVRPPSPLINQQTKTTQDDDPDDANKILESSVDHTTTPTTKEEEEEKTEEKDDSLGLNNSLSLIGEAYISEDSQGADPDELHIGKEPKVIFSCKPLVDKQNTQTFDSIPSDVVVNEEIHESLIIDTSNDEIKNDTTMTITEESLEIIETVESTQDDNDEQTVDEIMDEIEEKLLDNVNDICKNQVDDNILESLDIIEEISSNTGVDNADDDDDIITTDDIIIETQNIQEIDDETNDVDKSMELDETIETTEDDKITDLDESNLDTSEIENSKSAMEETSIIKNTDDSTQEQSEEDNQTNFNDLQTDKDNSSLVNLNIQQEEEQQQEIQLDESKKDIPVETDYPSLVDTHSAQSCDPEASSEIADLTANSEGPDESIDTMLKAQHDLDLNQENVSVEEKLALESKKVLNEALENVTVEQLSNPSDDLLDLNITKSVDETALVLEDKKINVNAKFSNSEVDIEEKKITECNNLNKDTDEVQQEENNDILTPEFEVSFTVPDEEKMDISEELLEDPLGGVGHGIEETQSNSEIESELESAVKFLRESVEEHDIESQINLPSKLENNDNKEKDNDHDIDTDDKITNVNIVDINELSNNSETMEIKDSIEISEAEIISEAVKLENEKLLSNDDNKDDPYQISLNNLNTNEKIIQDNAQVENENIFVTKSTVFPKTSILEERLKIPPKIEIPIIESSKIVEPTPKTPNLLIQNTNSSLNVESPKKDTDKHDFDNVGSPRIILKIAKSAITDCSEPKSPKSPKIHSPNLDPDSPSQKLSKIKLKLSKSGHPLIIPNNDDEDDNNTPTTTTTTNINNEKDIISNQQWHTEGSSSLSPLGMKIKLTKTGDATIIQEQHCNNIIYSPKRNDPSIGMKFKLSKTGDASIIQQCSDKSDDDSKDLTKRTDSPSLGMKIKFSKKGGASIVSTDTTNTTTTEYEHEHEHDIEQRRTESPLGMKIKLSKSGDASIIHETRQGSPSRTIVEGLGMKIKLSSTGHPTIIPDNKKIEEMNIKNNESTSSSKRKETTTLLSPIEIKKSKIDNNTLTKSITEFSNQTIINKEQNKKSTTIDSISRNQMNVINQEIDITHIKKKSQSRADLIIGEKLKNILTQNKSNCSSLSLSSTSTSSASSSSSSSSSSSDNIDTIQQKQQQQQQQHHLQSELIIVNENSNSSQDVMIIDDTSLPTPSALPTQSLTLPLAPPPPPPQPVSEPIGLPEVIIKVPRKRGRPRRVDLPQHQQQQSSPQKQKIILKDPLIMKDGKLADSKDNERPKRTCRSSQKSYAPPKRGRGRGRGKRKIDRLDRSDSSNYYQNKKVKLDYDNDDDNDDENDNDDDDDNNNLTIIDNQAPSSSSINIDNVHINNDTTNNSSELYKALKQPLKSPSVSPLKSDSTNNISAGASSIIDITKTMKNSNNNNNESDRSIGKNWLTPLSTTKNININNKQNDTSSSLQVIDEETRMSSDSFSRSQTPARQISTHGADTIINEESQGSVLSTATTESEKVKVKNRRMEINFDPDEGPFTVDKIAEYEWPLDRKNDTSMIQEQISQYLGVKSFKRKYPDLKRRMVDMEERNYLRENGLVSESMCDMGLTAVGSSEVLDIMCSDFPDHYEEYRKHMREKQIKEHSKKQKELTAAANAEKNRIDLAEMAVQSALSWNINLNKERKESRKCSLDLQTFTIHVPKRKQFLNKIKEYNNNKNCNYPVSLIPGQYTDYYREYSSSELRYYPLNTVIYGPMRQNHQKRKFNNHDSQSEDEEDEEESQSDDDNDDTDDTDSSSDDSSCSSSQDDTQDDTEESQSTIMDEVDNNINMMELTNQKDILNKNLKCKMCLKHLNKTSKSEMLVQCGTCNGYVHPSCIDLTIDMVPHIQAYAWQCTDCKTCAQCHDPADEDKMLFCDMCDRGYHIYCVGLRRVPQGRWHCTECAVCGSCGSRDAGGIANGDKNGVAQWQHEYKKGEKNTRVYVSTLCVPCSKLWRKGRYCPHCSRCHTVSRLDQDDTLVHCSACDKYLHLDCVENKDLTFDRKKYQCDFCLPKYRGQASKSFMSKVIKG